jgi:hypothetical protein
MTSTGPQCGTAKLHPRQSQSRPGKPDSKTVAASISDVSKPAKRIGVGANGSERP